MQNNFMSNQSFLICAQKSVFIAVLVRTEIFNISDSIKKPRLRVEVPNVERRVE